MKNTIKFQIKSKLVDEREDTLPATTYHYTSSEFRCWYIPAIRDHLQMVYFYSLEAAQEIVDKCPRILEDLKYYLYYTQDIQIILDIEECDSDH